MQVEPTLQELVARVRTALDDQTPLRIRGGGSKDFYGQELQGEILDTRGHAGIVSHEPSELVVTARAGTPLAELEAALAEHQQYLPFEPPHFKGEFAGGGGGPSLATVGGMVASGLNGPARASVGAVRDYVLGAQLLNGKAELLTFGGQVMKNVAGYDVSRLLAGSLGTLGLITQVSLKVLPRAVAEATLTFELDETQALARLNNWAGQALPLNASCWHGGALMLRLRGAKAAVASACGKLGGQQLDETQALRLWQALRDQTAPFFQLQEGEALLRLSVPDTAPALNLGPTLIEWHGAQRWIKLGPGLPFPGDADRLSEIAGHATLFRVTRAQDKARGVFTPLAAPLGRIHRELKQQFDPAGIFNRGRMYPDF
jgi:glycolate oxidase FAD binding subunit